MRFELACPECEPFVRGEGRAQVLVSYCSRCDADMRAMKPVWFRGVLNLSNEGPIGPHARKSIQRPAHEDARFVVGRDFRAGVVAARMSPHVHVMYPFEVEGPPRHPDDWCGADLAAFFKIHSPFAEAVPRVALCHPWSLV